MTRRGVRGFVWRGRFRGSPFGATIPDRPCVWVDEPVFLRVQAYANQQGIPMQRALDRIFGMERNGPEEKRRAIENRRRA